MPPVKKEARPSSRAGRTRTPAFVKNRRGVKNWKEVSAWLEWRGIEDIECITPDQAGIARGKMMPSKKFSSNTSLALPSAVFMTTISGGYPEDGNGFSYPEDDGDLKLMPDLGTLSEVPWESDPTAQVICDLVHQDGRSVEFTPRNVLKRVLAAYEARGLKPVVAPDILKERDQRLRALVAEDLKAGRKTPFVVTVIGTSAEIAALDLKGGAVKMARGGSSFDLLWADLSLKDKRNLAQARVRPAKPAEDVALAAFYEMALGNPAESLLRTLPPAEAEAVRALFKKP